MLLGDIAFCTLRHLQALAYLEQRCFPQSPWPPRLLRRDLEGEREPLTYLGIFWKGFLVGYGVFEARKEVFFLCRLGTDPLYEGRGFATQILLAGEVLARENGLRALELHVEEKNLRARRLYLSLGYAGIERLRDSGSSEESRLLCRRVLGTLEEMPKENLLEPVRGTALPK